MRTQPAVEIVALLTHRLDASVVAHYRALKRSESATRQVRLLWHVVHHGVPCPGGIDESDLLRFTGRDIRLLGLPLLEDRLVPGCQHYPLYHFFGKPETRPRTLWLVEHDVRFNGEWSSLFDHFAAFDDDLLACHLADHARCPRWPWWDLEHRGPGLRHRIPERRRLRAFLPLMRLSGDALVALRRWQELGWHGHSETLVPTLLHHHGYRLRDIGGDGPLVGDAERNRFYLGTIGAGNGDLSASTMRHRPPFAQPGSEPGMLYHPVKS